MYEKFLEKKSIFMNWQTGLLMLTFFGIRLVSFGLVGNTIIQAALVFVILMIFGLLYYKNPDWAFYFLLGEILLGGAGHSLEFLGLSIRSVLLITFLLLWFLHAIGIDEKHKLHIPHRLFHLLVVLGIFVLISAVVGLLGSNGIKPIIQDLAPYAFFLLVIPTYHLLRKKTGQEFLIRLIIAFLIGSTLFSFVTFFLFSSGIEVLQDPFYKWFRDIAAGKITDAGHNFYRIVLPEHLIITPIILFISSLLMRNEKHHHLWRFLLFMGIVILALNLSRTYFLALVIGLVLLKYKHTWSQWLRVSLSTLAVLFLTFSGIHFIASAGTSAGWDLLGLRLASISRPTLELSSHTRMELLEPIFNTIRQSPILGSGLGTSIHLSGANSLNNLVVTRQFDWGYLEMWAELGLVGSLVFLTLIVYLIILLIKKIRVVPDYHDFYVGLLAGVVSMLIMNLTAPALFHVMGVFYITLVIVVALKHESLLDSVVTHLYRVFHKIRT